MAAAATVTAEGGVGGAAGVVRLSGHTLDKATKAKVHLENYYSNLVSQHLERKGRHERLEETMHEEGLSEEQVRGASSQGASLWVSVGHNKPAGNASH